MQASVVQMQMAIVLHYLQNHFSASEGIIRITPERVNEVVKASTVAESTVGGFSSLYSRNNRRLVALQMFQACRRGELVLARCWIRDTSDPNYKDWSRKGYDGGNGLPISPHEGKHKSRAQHRGYDLFSPASSAILS